MYPRGTCLILRGSRETKITAAITFKAGLTMEAKKGRQNKGEGR